MKSVFPVSRKVSHPCSAAGSWRPCVHVGACLCLRQVCVCVCIYIYIYVKYIELRLFNCEYMCAYFYIHICIDIHIHIHIHIHVCVCGLKDVCLLTCPSLQLSDPAGPGLA